MPNDSAQFWLDRHHLKRPRRITLDAIVILLGIAALVALLYVQDKQIKRLKLEVETAKAKKEQFQTSPYASASDFAKHEGSIQSATPEIRRAKPVLSLPPKASEA